MWNISNILSLSRLVLAVPFGFLLWKDMKLWVFIFAGIAYVSDFLDGYFARKSDAITELGKIFDPLADKVFMGVAAVILLLKGIIPLWFGVAVVVRDVLIMTGSIFAYNKLHEIPMSNYIGKVTVTVVGLVILGAYLEIGFIEDYGFHVGFFFIVTSFINYMIRFFIIGKETRDSKVTSQK